MFEEGFEPLDNGVKRWFLDPAREMGKGCKILSSQLAKLGIQWEGPANPDLCSPAQQTLWGTNSTEVRFNCHARMLLCQFLAVMSGTEKGAPKAWQIAAEKGRVIDRPAAAALKEGEEKPAAKLADYTAEIQLFMQLFPANAREHWVKNAWALQCLDLVMLGERKTATTCRTALAIICGNPPLSSFDKVGTHGFRPGELPCWRFTNKVMEDGKEWIAAANKYRLRTNN